MPIWSAHPDWRNDRPNSLNPSLEVSKSSIFFRRRRGGEDDIGEPRGIGRENIRNHQELKVLECKTSFFIAGRSSGRIRSDYDERFDSPLASRFEHFEVAMARSSWHVYTPGMRQSPTSLAIANRPIARQEIG